MTLTLRADALKVARELDSFKYLAVTLGYTLSLQISSIDDLVQNIVEVDGDCTDLRGLTIVDDNRYCYVVWINSALNETYQLSTLTHELSHVLDAVYERIGAVTVDTEIRAYMIDYLLSIAL